MRSNMPSAWVEEYVSEGLHQHDYVLRHAATITESAPHLTIPFGAWRAADLPDEHKSTKRTLLGAADAGLIDAVAFLGESPAYSNSDAKRFFGFGFGGSPNTSKVIYEQKYQLLVAAFALMIANKSEVDRSFSGIFEKLTKRERDVLGRYAMGHRRDRIAWDLRISLPTVDLHTTNLRRKLKAQTIAEAVASGYLYGFL